MPSTSQRDVVEDRLWMHTRPPGRAQHGTATVRPSLRGDREH